LDSDEKRPAIVFMSIFVKASRVWRGRRFSDWQRVGLRI